MTKIKYICSLGFNCHTAHFMKAHNIKAASYPFDWIISNLTVVKKSIEDDFAEFLNKQSYVKLNLPTGCGHINYCDNMFFHHNPLENEKDYLYFNRCVERFRNLLKNPELKLFIISMSNDGLGVGHSLSDEIRTNFIDFDNFLENYTENYKILVIINYPDKKINTHKVTNINNLIFLEIDTLSSSNGITYQNNIDNIYLYDRIKTIIELN
jgi:hypothetical protein